METSAAGSAESGTLPGMSFDDLPRNWSDLPLDTPGLAADVADLFVGEADREGGCVAFLLTGTDRRLLQPLLVDEVQIDGDPEELVGFLAHLTDDARSPFGGVLFVRGRPGSVLLSDADRRWHAAVVAACRRSGLVLLGAFLATPAVVRSFPEPLTVTDVAS